MQHSNGGDGSPVIDEGELDDHDTLHTPEDYNDEDAAFHSTHDEQGHLIDENGTHPQLPLGGCGVWDSPYCHLLCGFRKLQLTHSTRVRSCTHVLLRFTFRK